jgi:membrane-bound lytic murein transglycosylase D
LPIEALRVLNPQYRKDVIPGNSRPYTLALPSQQIYSYLLSEDSITGYNTKKYQPRKVVEPQMEQIASDENGEYTYEKRTVTKTHKVRKGETLGKIAKRYGTSSSAIKRANGLKSNALKAGQRLKIKVTENVKVYRKVEEDSAEMAATEDAILKAAITPDEDKPKAEVKEEKKAAKKQEPKREVVEDDNDDEFDNFTGTHKVKKGENLSIIANKYGVTVTDLKQANGLKNNNLKAGQRLKVPKGKEKVENVSSSVTHTVRSGESLYLIAEHYGVTVNAIKNANNLSGNSIKPGQKLTIPKKSASKNTSRSKAKSSKKKK